MIEVGPTPEVTLSNMKTVMEGLLGYAAGGGMQDVFRPRKCDSVRGDIEFIDRMRVPQCCFVNSHHYGQATPATSKVVVMCAF